eukprot:TRINITY_DN66656_c6_g5_i1.p1 TRINITY_DN66656_c6_g5~~TRINITY_DN66656_c6_g5_i1.p1  ORF type:complete len:578 (-),score=22.50 TRINITY_DN66656_c6_g5_i1:977-2710(-)
MHAPKDVSVLPLQYKSHLCNNIPSVVGHSAGLVKAFEKYGGFLEESLHILHSVQTNMKSLLQHQFTSEATELYSCGNGLQSLNNMMLGHLDKLGSFTTAVSSHMSTWLEPNKSQLVSNMKGMQSDWTRLDKTWQEMQHGVIKARDVYNRKAAKVNRVHSSDSLDEGETQFFTMQTSLAGKLKSSLFGDSNSSASAQNTAMKAMKEAAEGYSTSASKFQAYVPKYVAEGTALLDQFEAADRCILDVLRESLSHWLGEYNKLLHGLLDDCVHLQALVNNMDPTADIDNFIVDNRKNPDPDPAQVFKFQMYTSDTMEGGTGKRESPTIPHFASAEEQQRIVDEMEAYVTKLCLRIRARGAFHAAPNRLEENAISQHLHTYDGRVALGRTLSKLASTTPLLLPQDVFNKLKGLMSTAFDESYHSCDAHSAAVLLHAAINCELDDLNSRERSGSSSSQGGVGTTGRNLAGELKDHPYLLDANFWSEFLLGTLDCKSPSELSRSDWLNAINNVKDLQGDSVIQTVCGHLTHVLHKMQSVGIDRRIQRDIIRKCIQRFQLNPEKTLALVNEALPHLRERGRTGN